MDMYDNKWVWSVCMCVSCYMYMFLYSMLYIYLNICITPLIVFSFLLLGFHDHLSDGSFASDLDRVNDHLSNNDRLPQLQVSPGRDSLTTIETPAVHSTASAQPVLLTPDAFISPRLVFIISDK